MSIQQNLIPNEPELKDLLSLFRKDLLLGLNCHAIATVQSFNPVNQTASATVNYKKTQFQRDTEGTYVATTIDYPILLDCPVIFLGGSAGALTFPVTPGDECLVLFNDRDIDNWFKGSSGSAVATPRLHSFSDGVIIVGVRSTANSLQDFNSTEAELKYGTTKIKVGADKMTLTVQAGVTVEIDNLGKLKITNATGEFIASLLDMLTTAITNTILGPQPLVFNPALLTIVESFKA